MFELEPGGYIRALCIREEFDYIGSGKPSDDCKSRKIDCRVVGGFTGVFGRSRFLLFVLSSSGWISGSVFRQRILIGWGDERANLLLENSFG
jgi:hypothetical protein